MRLNLLLTALAAASLAAASPHAAAIAEDMPGYTVELFPAPDASTVVIQGAIFSPIAKDVSEAIAKTPRGTPIVVSLDSLGGKLKEGEKLIAVLDAAKKSQEVTTFVDNGNRCLSMCIAIFMSGEKRIAGRASVWMIHAAHAYGSPLPLPGPTKRYLHDLAARGVSERWLRQLEHEHHLFSRPAELWLTGAELAAQNSNIATKVLPGFRTLVLQPATVMNETLGPR